MARDQKGKKISLRLPVPSSADVNADELPPVRSGDYTHSYWKNCWKRAPGDRNPDILCLEGGCYGLSFNTIDLTSTKYKVFEDDGLSYVDAMAFENRGRMDDLDDMDLVIEVTVGDKTYRAKSARPVNKNIGLCHGRLWEAGRIAQHYELVGIILEDADGGNTLECKASLFIVAWPQEFALTLSLQPPDFKTWQDEATWRKEFKISLKMGDWSTQQDFSGPLASNDAQEVTLTCSTSDSSFSSTNLRDAISIQVENKAAPQKKVIDVLYNTHFSCFLADINRPKRNFAQGYTDIRDADVFSVQIENTSGEDVYIPVMFYLRGPANPTGLVPMLWVKEDDADDAEYVPSGIKVQTSKNWHYPKIGNYLRAYTIIPARPGSQCLEFRVYYGFYGDLCSASHANLSLVGYTKDEDVSTASRWEQLAIGCFGETICFDIEMGLTVNTITDVRALMVKGKEEAGGKEWGWTNAGWGGDWLCAADDKGNKMMLGGVKVGYISQGPCLTEVRYVGHYGKKAEVHLDATVHTMRTNDYARTIQRMQYDFNSTVSFKDIPKIHGSCFFRVGGGAKWEGWFCRKVALCNGDGLLEEIDVPSTLEVGEFFVHRKELTGPAPWSIALPDSGFKNDEKEGKKGHAWKCLIIRSFTSIIGGETRLAPNVSLYARQSHGDGDFYVDALLTTKRGTVEFNPGDSVMFDAEWITVPYNADEYYGDNKALKEHLQENPMSWKTASREATGNNLSASVEGGEVTSNYPLIISTTASTPHQVIKLNITGGIGAVPIRFEGLTSKKYRLSDDSYPETSIKWYETVFCPHTQTYSMTFNLPLDDKPTSSWSLKQ